MKITIGIEKESFGKKIWKVSPKDYLHDEWACAVEQFIAILFGWADPLEF